MRAAVAIQRTLEHLRDDGEADSKMQFRVSAGIVNASVITWSVGGQVVGRDYLGAEVDAIFRLNAAIAANGIIINAAMNGDIKWRKMSRDLNLIADDAGNATKFLGRLSLKGLPSTVAHEVGWSNRFFGLSGGSSSQTPVDPANDKGPLPPRVATIGGVVQSALIDTTQVGHFYAFNAAGNSGWIQRHSSDQEQLICVFPNIVGGGIPEMGEIVCFVVKPGQPHKKAMQVLRSGTRLVGEVRQLEGNTAKVKVPDYAVKDHGLFEVKIEDTKVKQFDRVEFVLHLVDEGGGYRPLGRDGRMAGT